MSDAPAWLVGSGLDTDMKGDYRPGSGVFRFWMPKGSNTKVIFLTNGESAPVIWEHQVKIGGSFQNWFTCLRPLGMKCPLCEYAANNKGAGARYKAAIFSIIDTKEFVDKKGVKKCNIKKILAAKEGTAEKIKRRHLRLKENGSHLRGSLIEVYRTSSDKSPSCGEDFEYIKHVDLATLPDAAEFDYAAILKPDPEKVKAAVESLLSGGSASWSPEPTEEDTPSAPADTASGKVTY